MTRSRTTPPEGESLPGSVKGPGAQLAAARLRSGLSLREIAGRSRVGVDHLEAIEREDWLALPGPVYVRGFVKLYAREVGLNASLLLDALDRQLLGREQVRVRTRQLNARAARGERFRRIWAVAVVGVALAVLLIAWATWQVRSDDAPHADPVGGPQAP